MILPKDKTKYLAQFRYVELARYVPSLDKVIREQKNKESILVDIDEVSNYAKQHQNKGIYTSVFQYKTPQISDIALGPLYFDFDSSTAESARQDTRILVKYLQESCAIPESALRIYFTGLKGFHVELEPISLGITPGSNLPEVFRYIATVLRDKLQLSTIDFAVYDKRRMWRLPLSQHQRGDGLYKVPVSTELLDSDMGEIRHLAKEAHKIVDPEVSFSLEANEWYRSLSYQLEESKKPQYTQSDIIERFQRHGTSSAIDPYRDRVFDAMNLFENCPTIMRLWEKSEKEHNLEHEERLFLCSILTYTDEAIDYLHAILRNCDDYNFERSESHIRDWIARREKNLGGRPYSCKRANAVGVGCGDCADRLEAKPKYEKIGDKLYPTDEKAEISPIRFAYSKGTTK